MQRSLPGIFDTSFGWRSLRVEHIVGEDCPGSYTKGQRTAKGPDAETK
jgi:hypothetical protein